MNRKKTTRTKLSATSVFSLGFLVLILLGTLLLTLPISSASGQFTNPLDAAFTAVSATCVTGLITVDTATAWSSFGHTVIIVLIQIGGLGFMTVAMLLSLVIRRNITPQERRLAAISYNLDEFDSIMQLVKRILVGTFAIELIGAMLLATRFVPDFGWALGIRKSIFHSISAFCNAGFDTIGVGNAEISGMSHYLTDPIVNLTLSALIILGGIGFLVWNELYNFFFKRKRLSAYAKLVLIVSTLLLTVGTLLFAVGEWNNPQTLGAIKGFFPKLMASFFQSVTWRTAGFAMMDNGCFTESSQLLGILLMFVGGASGSTAGGVKVGTIGILFYTVWCVFLGKKNTVMFGRTVSDHSFVRATSVIIMQITAALLGTLILSVSTPFHLIDVLYEVVSAISTVGVTTGITPQLSVAAKLTDMILMYFGRVGVLTVSYAVLNSLMKDRSAVEYPEAKMLIG
ncbi:MAG: Trk family potassium uptake protein [Clostridia bacterium]|nr:Trk family potassium uptake protein [Clostridia bacterium]